MLTTKLSYCCVLILAYLTHTLQSTDAEYIQDPRKNSSHYDLLISQNQKYGSVIGNVGQILLKKQRISDTKLIFSYKLIYYSPQIIPSSLFRTVDDSARLG